MKKHVLYPEASNGRDMITPLQALMNIALHCPSTSFSRNAQIMAAKYILDNTLKKKSTKKPSTRIPK